MTTPNACKAGFESGAVVGGVMLWDLDLWSGYAVTLCNELINGATFTYGQPVNLPGFPDVEMVSEDTFYCYGLIEFTKENVKNYDF
jgi:hypothetical protein